MYLRQQPQSFLSRDALQFHAVRSLSVQDVIDELVHSRPTGYFHRFFLLLGKFPSMEESDGMLRPRWSLGLDGEDQRHFLRQGSGHLDGKSLTLRRS